MTICISLLSRRDLICRYGLAALSCQLAARLAIPQNAKITETKPGTLVHHPDGHYSFIQAISAYSAGVVARNGYEIVHATFSRSLSLSSGFATIDEHFKTENLTKRALCGLELRSPGTLSSDEFRKFNSRYIDGLRSWNLLLEGDINPIARTNVVPVLSPPAEPSIYGFSYVKQSSAPGRRTFIVAGGGELPDGSTNTADIFRRGESNPAALQGKARYVMARMQGRLNALGVSWPDVSAIDVYTVHDLSTSLLEELLRAAGRNTVTWNYAHPPINDLEFEMDLRGVRSEIVL